MGNRNLVWLGLAVLLANAVRFAPPASGGQVPGGGPSPKRPTGAAQGQVRAKEPDLPEFPDDNPFVLLCTKLTDPQTVRESANPALIPPGCQTWTPIESTTFANRLRFVIATVPDPEETHLTLLFDRMVESIQRAAEDNGYSFDIHWLPWHTPESVAKEQEESDPEIVQAIRLRRAQRKRFPGLLLFRKATEDKLSYLAVFLVGESPISGIDRTQIANALAYVPAGISPSVPILGPSFSGSESWLQESLGEDVHHRRILSGTATRLPRPGSSTQHDDVFAMKKLLSYLSGLERDQLLNLALVHEGATDYGGLSTAWEGDKAKRKARGGKDKDEFKGTITPIGFPKDIARLRNAYEEHQMWAKSQAGSPAASASSGLTLKLKDDPGGRDSMPSYSASQTPLAQDAGLSQIAAILRLDDIRTAGVIATDVLDTIFLMRYLHVSCPDVHLFTMDSDLLLARSGDSISLLGTLAATTYPLFPASQDWTSNDRHLVFDSALSEGTYNAMQLLLGDGSVTDYSTPFRPDSSVPPLWLTVVARHGYRPVALLDDGKSDDKVLASKVNPSAQKHWEKPQQPVSRAWLLVFVLIVVLSGAWAAAIIAGQFLNWRTVTDFRVSKSAAGAADRAAILSVGTSALAGLMLVAFSAPLKFATVKDINAAEWTGMLQLGRLVLAVLLLLLLFLVPRSFTAPASRRTRSVFLAATAAALFVAFWVSWDHLLWNDARLQSFFFVVRGVDLISGVSPFLPFFLILPAFAIWAWVALQRKIFIDERRPTLPADGDGWRESPNPDAALKPIAPLSQLARNSVDDAIVTGSTRSVVKGAVLFLAVGGLLFIESIFNLHSFEQTTFDWIFRSAIALLAGTIFLAWGKFLYIWHRLRLWLEEVELHPLRLAFSLLPPNKSWSPLWVRQIRKRNHVVTARSLETLKGLLECCDRLPAGFPELAEQILKTAAQGDSLADSAELRSLLARAAGLLQTDILAPQWRKGGSEALGTLADSREWKDTLKRKKKELEEYKPFILASEFVAWRYVAYIRYATVHLENLLAFMSGGFILIVLSLSSYPFLSQHLIGWLIGIMFAILGIGIVKVFAQMDRDATLSRLTKSESGKLGGSFYLKLASFGALPVLTLLSAYFPTIGSFLGSLVQPAVQALH